MKKKTLNIKIKADKPIKGVDYFTPEEQEFFVKSAMDLIKVPEVDYKKVEKFIKSEIKKIPVPEVKEQEPIDYGSIISSVLKEIPTVEPVVIDYDEIQSFIDKKIKALNIEERLHLNRITNSAGPRTRLGELVDVEVQNATPGQVLSWNGSQWVPITVSGGGGAVDSVNGQTGVVVLDTDDIADTATNRYTNDTDITRLANTSGTNTGDQDLSGYALTSSVAELSQDAVGTILTDTSTIDFTYDDTTPTITADVKDNSITFAKMEDISQNHFIGRHTAGSGDPQMVSATQARSILNVENGAEVNTIDTVSDTAEIDLTITARDLTASIVTGSIDETKLDTSVNASLDLADSALQSSDIGVSVQAHSTILDNTTASFTTADETKLDHITVTQAVDLDQMETDIAALANGMVYKGDWAANAGTFAGGGVAQTGWFYYVSVAGTVDGVSFAVGDNIVAIVDNASTTTYAGNWSKHDQTDAVQSVNGNVGAVVLDADSIAETASRIWFTSAEETKLAGIETGAEVNTIDTVTDTSEIDLTVTARALSASIVAGSIDETKLDTSVNASLDLADSSLQPANISNTAYDATSWNGVTTIAPSKNAVRDKIDSMDTIISGKQDTLVSGTNIKTINSNSLLGSGDLSIPALTDGDKGDITVSALGTVWDIDNNAVTLAKMASINSDKLLGRITAGGGIVEEVDFSDIGQAILANTTALQVRTTIDAQEDLSGASLFTTTIAVDDKILIQDTSGSDGLRTVTPQNVLDLMTFTDTDDIDFTRSTNAVSAVLKATAISAKTSVTAAATDTVLIGDASDSNNLKKTTAQDIANLGTGNLLQIKYSTKNTQTTTVANIPYDASIPQQTEGAEWDTITITPISATSLLEIEFSATVSLSELGGVVGALFKDSTANALSANAVIIQANNYTAALNIKHYEISSSTSSRTYKIRWGVSGGTGYINRRANEASFGGVQATAFTIREYKQ